MREDILGGLKNALERGESIDDAKESFIAAGYSKAEIEEAAASIESIKTGKSAEIPTIFSANLQTQKAEEGIKPLPQITIKKKFHYWLLIPIILVSALIAYLIYNILLAQ